jgi:hypothetical protein
MRVGPGISSSGHAGGLPSIPTDYPIKLERSHFVRSALSGAEWRAVTGAFIHASTDACGSADVGAAEPTGWRKLARRLFGMRASPTLSDPQLQTVRDFICCARTTGRPSESTWEALRAMGYSEAQVEALAWLALEGAPG